MWSVILSFLGGPLINGILQAYRDRLKSINTQDHMALDLLQKEVDADAAARAEATKLLIAEQGHWFTRSVRPTLGWVINIFLAKVLLYDKAFGSWTGGHTDGLDPNLWSVVMVVIGSYFGVAAVERVGQIFKR